MANRTRRCTGCKYQTADAHAMDRHMKNTGHNRTKAEYRYIKVNDKSTKKVRI